MSILFVFLLYGIWSLAFPIGKCMLAYSPPIFVTGFRMVLAGSILLGYLTVRKRLPQKLDIRQIMAIVMLSILSIYLANILEFWSLSHLSAAKTCFIFGLSPFIAALLSYFHFNERMTPLKWLGMSIGFLGFLPMTLVKHPDEALFSTFSHFSLPELSMFLSVFFSVYGWIILRIVVRGHNISPLYANGSSMLIGGLLALGTSYFVDTWAPLPIAEGAFTKFIGWTLLLTFLSNIFCYNFYGYLLKYFTTTLLSFVGLFSPIFTSIHSWIILGEAPSMVLISSNFIVLLGLYLVYREELKQGYLGDKPKEAAV